MEETVKQQIQVALRSIGRAISDAEDHLKMKDIDRACIRLSDAKNMLGKAIPLEDTPPIKNVH